MAEKMTDEEIEALLGSNYAEVYAHIAALTAERDERLTRDEEMGLRTELTSLRERVQALEKDARRYWEDMRFAQKRLAAIRQRAGKVMADSPSLVPVLRAVVGEADAGAEEPVRVEDWTQHPEPSTAEALATVRKHLVHSESCTSSIPGAVCSCPVSLVLPALALLERRMGAMGRQVRTIADAAKAGSIYMADVNALTSALTDAPPVFTLEEVEALISKHMGPHGVPDAFLRDWVDLRDSRK